MPHDNENDNSTAVIDAEAAPAEKAEKPKRAPRKKAEAKPVEEPAPPVEVKTEEAPAPVETAPPAPEEAPAAPAEAPQRQPAAETVDIRVTKDMKLPDLTKLAKEHGVENATG